MKVSDEILNEWKELKEYGDVKALSKILQIAHSNVSVMLGSGKGSVMQIACIKKFYANRKKKVKMLNTISED